MKVQQQLPVSQHQLCSCLHNNSIAKSLSAATNQYITANSLGCSTLNRTATFRPSLSDNVHLIKPEWFTSDCIFFSHTHWYFQQSYPLRLSTHRE